MHMVVYCWCFIPLHLTYMRMWEQVVLAEQERHSTIVWRRPRQFGINLIDNTILLSQSRRHN